MGSTLRDLIAAEPVDLRAIEAHLESLSGAQRVDAIRSLGGTHLQRRLYEACAQSRRVVAADLVPSGTAVLQPVIHYGKNSLPTFTHFEKRFCRPSDGADELWGYNEQSNSWFTGPGYFVAHGADGGGMVIDYRKVPPRGADGWPTVRPNGRGFSRFVYGDMVDVLRRVSDHVVIGRATRHGKDLDAFFILCREEPASPLVSSPTVEEGRNLRDVGGTPGGLWEFLIGVVMACAGGYLIT